MAERCGVNRQDFLDHYFGRELDPRWVSRVKRLSGKGWKKFAEKQVDEIKLIRKDVGVISSETGLIQRIDGFFHSIEYQGQKTA